LSRASEPLIDSGERVEGRHRGEQGTRSGPRRTMVRLALSEIPSVAKGHSRIGLLTIALSI